jgi:hypothetical protein
MPLNTRPFEENGHNIPAQAACVFPAHPNILDLYAETEVMPHFKMIFISCIHSWNFFTLLSLPVLW